MAHRNLTSRYLKLRASLSGRKDKDVSIVMPAYDGSHSTEAHQELLKEDGQIEPIINLRELPPLWVDLLDEIDDGTEKISMQSLVAWKKNVGLLKNSHRKRLESIFEDPQKIKRLDDEINTRTQSITSLFRSCQSKLKKVALKGNEEGTELPYQERVVRLNVMKSRAIKVQKLTTSFRTAQRDYLNKLNSKSRQGKGFYDSESIEATIPNLARIEQGFTEDQLHQLELQEQNASQRTKEIIALAKSVNELAQMFNELAILVVEQGSVLDRIDYNVEQTVESLKDSKKQLAKAEDHQKASRSALCIILLIVLIFICVFILIIRQSTKK